MNNQNIELRIGATGRARETLDVIRFSSRKL